MNLEERMVPKQKEWWNVELEKKPDFERCMERIYAWYNKEIIDRAPIRFSAHNAEYSSEHKLSGYKFETLKERWWNTQYQLDLFEYELENSVYNAETFPIFWPNLGPEVYTAFYGVELNYQDVTAYSVPIIKDWNQIKDIKLNKSNPYFQKLEEMTFAALERCKGKYLVGYTDLHPGIDCAAAFRDPQELCMDIIMEQDKVQELIHISSRDFEDIFNHFDGILKRHNQLSVTWMGIPSFGKMHIPSCDFAALLSPDHFNEFILPVIQNEVRLMTHNVFHMDGKGVAKNINAILEIPEITAIQWVQGMGTDKPILQWIHLIKKIQAAGKSVVVDLEVDELSSFMELVEPEGILLCIDAAPEIQPAIIKKLTKWNK